MPKIVDHEKQKQLLAEATWRIIRRHGMEQASVRHIAEEAGISVGSLRHYFATQSELFAYSMQLVSERVDARISSLPFSGPPLEDMKKVLCQLLPMDEESRSEMEVWIAFMTKALADPSLKALGDQVFEKMRLGIHSIIESLVQLELAAVDLNVDLETARLHSLIDGLAMHAVIRPDSLSPERLEELVTLHLKSLCKL
ncbi:TetR family transcriptional regulator [Paenibacillus zeisoli]|uniref:TetR family transcriptional regulator n=1 Tax=Paenibacillus zeisoli TaxID=2496267 RepID=A0A3S1B516_9BACL|nr:TetR/AcrR family transcriptional regulator [Paenibacillus zeisoli]RUT27756.1 TetR family transcriptional regulator [Paenibacillus zeisoli]